MKKGEFLNSEIISLMGTMGHTDSVVIGDAGLPIPDGVKRIDISLIKSVPGFVDTLKAVASELEVEKVVLAEEIKNMNTAVLEEILKIYSEDMIEFVPHEEFKNKTKCSKAVVRTGECTPYANIILYSGVTF